MTKGRMGACTRSSKTFRQIRLGGGRHSTAVAFTLHAQPARVRITAPENFSDVAVLINSKDSAEKA